MDFRERAGAAIRLLPSAVKGSVTEAFALESIEEIRLRVGRPPQIVASDGEKLMEGPLFTRENAAELLERLCRHSVYSFEDELKQGFISYEGGIRVGVCGRRVSSGDRLSRLTDISSFNIRLPREVVGCAEAAAGLFSEKGRPVSSLVFSPPAGGKTTLLRDIARCFSYGIGVLPCKVAVADERGELSGSVNGMPTFDVGPRTDVFDLVPKAEAMEMLIRSMSPELIVTDELGGERDAEAVFEASRCGTAVIASVHAGSIEQLKNRRGIADLLENGTFLRLISLKRRGSKLYLARVVP